MANNHTQRYSVKIFDKNGFRLHGCDFSSKYVHETLKKTSLIDGSSVMFSDIFGEPKIILKFRNIDVHMELDDRKDK